jgi:hypothetical protein
MPESRSIVQAKNREPASSGLTAPGTDVTVATRTSFTSKQRDAAFHSEVERLVAWARELLDPTPGIIDSVSIRERKAEASLAVLDVLWAVLAEYNAMEGEPRPLPGLIAHLPEMRRLRRSSAS